MKLTFSPSIPDKEKVDKITRTLNGLSSIHAVSEFINEIPRRYVITIEMPNETKSQDILEIGRLIGVME